MNISDTHTWVASPMKATCSSWACCSFALAVPVWEVGPSVLTAFSRVSAWGANSSVPAWFLLVSVMLLPFEGVVGEWDACVLGVLGGRLRSHLSAP